MALQIFSSNVALSIMKTHIGYISPTSPSVRKALCSCQVDVRPEDKSFQGAPWTLATCLPLCFAGIRAGRAGPLSAFQLRSPSNVSGKYSEKVTSVV